MKKYLLVRTPLNLIQENKIAIGWSSTDFSKFADANALIKELKSKHIKFGRRANQIKKYFNLKKGDIVIVPSPRAIRIAEVVGEKIYNQNFENGHGANQITVKFLTNSVGIVKISRSHLLEKLETRLKLMRTVGDLTEFRDEIENLITSIQNDKIIHVDEFYNEKVEQKIQDFKINLLNALRQGQTRIAAGGRGLEELIHELLVIQGYSSVKILGKTNGKGVSDVDIQAISENNPFLKNVLVQVKHHRGLTGQYALEQIKASESDLDIDLDRWVITTGSVDERFSSLADELNINVMDGQKLVEWIYANLESLSSETKAKLGILNVPQLSWIP